MKTAIAIIDADIRAKYSAADIEKELEEVRTTCERLDPSDGPGAYEETRVTIGKLRKTRVAIEARRVDLKAESLETGRRIDATAKVLTASIEAIEGPLRAKKQVVDEAESRAKFDRDNAERLAEEARLRAERQADEARLAEVARLQAIEADRILMENAKLEMARKAEEKRAKAEREAIEAERRRVEEEQRAAARVEADRAAKARAEEDARVAAERQQLAAERAKLDAERRAAEQAEADRVARIAAEEAAKARAAREAAEAEEQRIAALEREAAARARIEALRPDAEKLRSFAADVIALCNKAPALTTSEARDAFSNARDTIADDVAPLQMFGSTESEAA